MRRRAFKASHDPKILALVALAVFALLGATLFGYVTLRDTTGTTDRATPVSVHTTRFVSRSGGFSLSVPDDLKVTRSGSSARFTSADKDLVVSVGPIAGGPLSDATQALLETVRSGYPQLRLQHGERQQVDGRSAMSIYGQVRNTKGTALRFVVVTIPGRKHNYAVTAFTAHDSDPRVVLPRVDAILSSFHVLGDG